MESTTSGEGGFAPPENVGIVGCPQLEVTQTDKLIINCQFIIPICRQEFFQWFWNEIVNFFLKFLQNVLETNEYILFVH